MKRRAGKLIISPGFWVAAAVIWSLTPGLWAEPRTWRSTSGSTIEARFLGAFGEDYWFEASEDGRFIKMPAKYISEEDLKLVAAGEVVGSLPATICDSAPASIKLLEQIYTQAATPLDPDTGKLEDAVGQLIAPFQPADEAEADPIEISFTKRKYKRAPAGEAPPGESVYTVLRKLLEPHALDMQIREGGLIIGRF